jgi:RimJ/RimL family protein N-acetyltransferase
VRAVIDHLFTVTDLDAIAAGCRVTNNASRRVIEKCGFQWTGAALLRVRALGASVPADRFRLERSIWASLRAWGKSGLPKTASARKKNAR